MLKIRHAGVGDLEKIQALNDLIFIDNPKYDDDLIPNFGRSRAGTEFFKEAITRKDGCCFVAEDNGQMVGYLDGCAKEFSYRKSKYFEVVDLGVIPEIKGQGIGTKLLEAATEWAREHGFQRIYLLCFSKNTEALEFYRKRGFDELDVVFEKKI